MTDYYAQTPITKPTAAISIKYHVSDCHFHLVDFLQHTQGVKAALAAMNRAGVDDTMLCGMPLVKEWSRNEPVQPGYYLDDAGQDETGAFLAKEFPAVRFIR